MNINNKTYNTEGANKSNSLAYNSEQIKPNQLFKISSPVYTKEEIDIDYFSSKNNEEVTNKSIQEQIELIGQSNVNANMGLAKEYNNLNQNNLLNSLNSSNNIISKLI